MNWHRPEVSLIKLAPADNKSYGRNQIKTSRPAAISDMETHDQAAAIPAVVDKSKAGVSQDASSKASRKFTVDMTKPIVCQVGHLGADYDGWVHQPVTSKGSPRFFENGFLEMGTKAKWWMVPAIWGPPAMLLQKRAVSEGLPAPWVPLVFLAGLLAWTLTEYLLHRFLFHMSTTTYWANTIHYVIHGFHHKHPMDADRLVFPPFFTLGIATPMWYLLQLVIRSPALHSSIFGGMLMGYVLYDLTHYFLHFGTAFNDRLYKMKKDHSNHHFKNQMHNFGFGVTSSLWDVVFNTLPPSKLKRGHGPNAVGIQPSSY